MEKGLKKMTRLELLQLLLRASEANEALVAENDALRKEASSRASLPRTAKVGSIAEAALQANGYFEAVQRSADDYLREIKRLHDQIASRAAQMQQGQVPASVAQSGVMPSGMPIMQPDDQAMRRQAQAYLQDAQNQAEGIVVRANQQAQAIVADARARSEAAIADANRQANSIISQANRRADALLGAVQAQTGQPAYAAHYAPTSQTTQSGQAGYSVAAGQAAQYGSAARSASGSRGARHAQHAYAAQPAFTFQRDASSTANRGRHVRVDGGLGRA